jgi:hypothetical protein
MVEEAKLGLEEDKWNTKQKKEEKKKTQKEEDNNKEEHMGFIWEGWFIHEYKFGLLRSFPNGPITD